jgi:hypothetical protein
VGFQNQLLLLRFLNEFVGFAVGVDADENPNFFRLGERRINFVKAADVKITDEAIKEARIPAEQHAKSVAQALTGFVCDECQVR